MSRKLCPCNLNWGNVFFLICGYFYFFFGGLGVDCNCWIMWIEFWWWFDTRSRNRERYRYTYQLQRPQKSIIPENSRLFPKSIILKHVRKRLSSLRWKRQVLWPGAKRFSTRIGTRHDLVLETTLYTEKLGIWLSMKIVYGRAIACFVFLFYLETIFVGHGREDK